jgi:hydroxymethylpyrimidine/phosphomethylpyrimidine kinase
MKKVLTIAGSDSSGGAGVQGDLKTFFARGVLGASAITAVTAQNSKSIDGVVAMPADFVAMQIRSVMHEEAISVWKTGMLASAATVSIVSDLAKQYKAKLIVDPVMAATSGKKLLARGAEETLKKELLPKTYVLTANIPEAEILARVRIMSLVDMKHAATILHAMGVQYVVIKGGHRDGHDARDMLFDGREYREYHALWVKTEKLHGTGCMFASCIAAEIAKGNDVYDSVAAAKKYVTSELKKRS